MARRILAVAILLLAPAMVARAGDRLELTGLLDLRVVAADGTTSYLNGGLGRTRFDSDHDGVQLGRLMLAGRFRLTDTLTLNAVAESYADGDVQPAGFSQAYLDWRPFPTRPVRFRLRAGAFYPPVSLEHRQVGWTSPYTLSTSALNTWIGEEFRVIGTELEARWLGASQGYNGDVALVGGVYGWNDGAGTIMADRGWALTDRPSLLLGGLGHAHEHLYTELDGRPGYYAGVAWRHGEALEVRALHYDNRADPGAHNSRFDFAWETRFTSVGVRYEPTDRVTLMAQHLDGKTYVGPDSAGPDQFALRVHPCTPWRATSAVRTACRCATIISRTGRTAASIRTTRPTTRVTPSRWRGSSASTNTGSSSPKSCAFAASSRRDSTSTSVRASPTGRRSWPCDTGSRSRRARLRIDAIGGGV